MSPPKKPDVLLPVLIYCRVSSTKQATDGISLDHQEHIGRLLCQAHFPEHPVQVWKDVYTGTRTSRPGYRVMVDLVCSAACHAVVSWDHSRLCRNSSEFQRLLRNFERHQVILLLHNIGICSFTAVGRLTLSLLGTFAEFESNQLGERMKQFHRRAYEERRLGPGKRPFGWEGDGDGLLIEVPIEQKLIDLCVFGKAKGKSWSQLSEEANAMGISSVEGKPFTAQLLHGCIRAASRRREDYARLPDPKC